MKRLPAFTATQPTGELLQVAEGECVFNYKTQASTAFVSLTMPVRAKSYAHRRLLPVFEMHLPEGYLLAVIKKHFGKLGISDDFALLSLLAPSLKGRVTLNERAHAATAELSLVDVLDSPSPDLFEALVQRFALNSPLSGVQPKVLTPLLDKATLRVEDFVVKSWGSDYPHLALNEWLCMRCLQEAQVEVPEFYLSEDERLFVMRRFDRHPHGGYWGFEDFCVLQAKSRDEKYTGSYEQLAKSIMQFVSPAHRQRAMTQFFKAQLLNQSLQNGDAHLKNFGVLYSSMTDVRLAPIYDVVCTTAYIPKDMQALTLRGTKRFVSLKEMQRFGIDACGLTLKQIRQLTDECRQGLAWLASETERLLDGADDASRADMLSHTHRLAAQGLD
ncbi:MULTISPECIES: type II toxin-antitoxin system HipA family toxin [Thiorhodovibrio]|uniref:type II toxin-antitoxin system HipA family toxin n=1 Tax=Thiorhodovibrio TaxID=61593 RepID=UPI0019148AAD|nr:MULTISPECIES: type II toxin-antitoxin system HipA family toxin [Thiorhodovibrio]MBK5970278.1 phosphatidylinositol kinase [Thiorhodovibrio winogradskyi]WPL14846.1 Serine/threonine-protein kinase HipA [Thiorhodovibrio litoralis]